MTQLTEQNAPATVTDQDLGNVVQQVLQASAEPLTLSKIRAQLPAQFRSIGSEELADFLRRQVAAQVLWQFPRYRSQQDRFWDRPMTVHIAALLRAALVEGPLGWSELRRKLPAYAWNQAEVVLQEQLAQGKLFKHPRLGRSGDRFGIHPADPKTYLRAELPGLFQRLGELGFTPAQLRAGALELLHDEEWALVPPTSDSSASTVSAQPQTQTSQPAAEPQTKPPSAQADSSSLAAANLPGMETTPLEHP